MVRFLVDDLTGISTEIDFSEIYFTVKKTARDRAFLFQKRLSTGGILKLGLGDYQVKIEPSDTDNLSYGNYLFDIQLVWNDEQGDQQLKETFVGDFVVEEEITFSNNEEV